MAADWLNWRGPNLDGVSAESIPEDLPEQLPVVWTRNVGIGFCTVSVVGNRVLTMGNKDDQDTIWCLDATSGEALWKHTYDCELDPLYYEGGPGGTPTIHEGSVYTLSKKGHAFRLDLETGEVLWDRNLVSDHDLELPEWSFACSPVIDGENILYNVGRQGLALARESGETVWLPDNDTSGYASFVPFSHPETGTTHLLFSAKSIMGINSKDGSKTWEVLWKSSRDVNAADPVIISPNEFVVSSSSGTSLISLASGKPETVWEQKDLKWYFNPGVHIDGFLYSLHGTTHRPTELICTDASTGETVWLQEGFGSGGLMSTESKVLLFDQGTLTIFKANPKEFQPVHRQKILEGKCWTSPVLSNGNIYCRNAEGDVACVRLESTDG